MKKETLSKIMAATNKTAVNVASEAGVGISTVYRFLGGLKPRKSTIFCLQEWVNKNNKAQK